MSTEDFHSLGKKKHVLDDLKHVLNKVDADLRL